MVKKVATVSGCDVDNDKEVTFYPFKKVNLLKRRVVVEVLSITSLSCLTTKGIHRGRKLQVGFVRSFVSPSLVVLSLKHRRFVVSRGKKVQNRL